FKNKNLFFQSELSFLRVQYFNKGYAYNHNYDYIFYSHHRYLSQILPKGGWGYSIGDEKISFKPFIGFYSKFLLNHHNITKPNFFIFGTFIKSQIVFNLN